MKILVTGAKGFVGQNLVVSLENIKNRKDRTRSLVIDDIYEYDLGDEDKLEKYCKDCDFVFNLAGVNRPKNQSEFMKGNFDFVSTLLNTLKNYNNKCGVMLSSSIQAILLGRYAGSEYGRSKLAGEEIFFEYGKENDVNVYVYRFPNLFGKWCKPNYNSVVATFCHNIANDLEITVNDVGAELELLYIDDLINEMLDILENKEHHCDFDGMNAVADDNGRYCYVPTTYHVTLGKVVELLNKFKEQPGTLVISEIPDNSFAKKLYSTYLSYLPREKTIFPLKMSIDERGSFTELLKTENCGQFSVNISKPGITKGQHWHHSKNEKFLVVSGKGLIQFRDIYSNEIIEYYVSGDRLEVIDIPTGYTHNIINIGESDMVTIMWANEKFNPEHPDTYYEEV